MIRIKRLVLAAAVFLIALSFWPKLVTQAEAVASEIKTVNIALSMPAVEAGEVASAKTSISSAGCYINSSKWYDMYGQPLSGKFTKDNATLEIYINASPGYSFAADVEVTIGGEAAAFVNYGTQLAISKTYVPVIWAPGIVKHPGDEIVMEGALISFVAYGSFTTESNWMVIDQAGRAYTAQQLTEKFPGTYVESSYDKLKISPAIKALNGFRVKCVFSGPGGSVETNTAEIIVDNEMAAALAGITLPDHEHSYSTELSHDAGYHWYGCDCGERGYLEEHQYLWTQNEAATSGKSGKVTGQCQVCGYIISGETVLDSNATVPDSGQEIPEIPAEIGVPAVQSEDSAAQNTQDGNTLAEPESIPETPQSTESPDAEYYIPPELGDLDDIPKGNLEDFLSQNKDKETHADQQQSELGQSPELDMGAFEDDGEVPFVLEVEDSTEGEDSAVTEPDEDGGKKGILMWLYELFQRLF